MLDKENYDENEKEAEVIVIVDEVDKILIESDPEDITDFDKPAAKT